MPGVDLSHWHTKKQAADILGVSEKSIERFAAEGRIQRADLRRPGKPPLAVYCPEDVDRLKAERESQQVQPFVMPADKKPDVAAAMMTTLAAIADKVHQPAALPAPPDDYPEEMLPPSELRFKVYLTRAEAVAYSGLPDAILDDFAEKGKLHRVTEKVRGFRYRRADLDKL